MAIQIRVMSWNIQKRTNTATYIAELMRVHQIDIAAFLEMPNTNVGGTLASIVAALNNLATAYYQYQWLSQAVNVGNESVGYVWHQNATVGANAFQVDIKANGGQRVFGAVTRNSANARIYFPKKSTGWGSLPGTPPGRRPAYMSFVTNDGAAARRFTVLDIHTPFVVLPATPIQSYSTSLFATSREITQVDRTDLTAIATAASLGLSAALAATVDPWLNAMAAPPVAGTLRNDAVTSAAAAITGDEIDLAALIVAAGIAGAGGALNNIPVPQGTSKGDCKRLSTAAGIAGAGAAAAMVAGALVPTAPPAATASAVAARNAATALAAGVANQFQVPAKRSPSALWQQVKTEAERIASVALAPFTFNALPLSPVNTAIIAGDFNVDYPDGIGYSGAEQTKLGGVNYNAYTRLLAFGAARNTEASTRIGPTAFRGQQVYQLHTPNPPIQNTNSAGANYAPINLATLVGTPTSYMNWTSWNTSIKALALGQGLQWDPLWQTYGLVIEGAFDRIINNDTRYYRANCYDNIFVRNATAVNASGVIDVINELGSWAGGAAIVNPQPVFAPNPWLAATGRLNLLAQAFLGTLTPPLDYTYNGVTYTITAALADGVEAAVFFHQYISDHLPVFVQVQL